MINWLPSTIEKLKSCDNLDGLKTIMMDIQEKLNYDFILYSIQISKSFKESSISYIGNFPDKWIKRYEEKDYLNIDPIVKHCISSNIPLCWYEFYNDKNININNFFKDANKHGLIGGISSGFRINSGETGILSMAKKETVKENDNSYCSVVMHMTSLQPYIHDSLNRISLKNKEIKKTLSLTKRELECLTWIADGKTSGEISTILKISESTVIFHIKNIIKKLEVNNRTQAISKAMLLGLLYPNNNENHINYLSFK